MMADALSIIAILLMGAGGIGVMMSCIGDMLTGFTPGRRTRGIARWWARCTRWTHKRRIEPHRDAQTHRGEAVLTPEDIRTINAKRIHGGVEIHTVSLQDIISSEEDRWHV